MALSEAAKARRTAQRRIARQLERGERPLGGKYQKYVISSLRQQAHRNVKNRLGHYENWRYDDKKVREAIWQIMDTDEIIWTVNANTEELRSRAGSKGFIILFKGNDRNPWWYHRD